jgi:hypothetical protein
VRLNRVGVIPNKEVVVRHNRGLKVENILNKDPKYLQKIVA